ncbi:MAG TPA: hypothetical protein VIL74_18535 [Pyrinomonadaceae bacterium]|jgi:hypothetical protein
MNKCFIFLLLVFSLPVSFESAPGAKTGRDHLNISLTKPTPSAKIEKVSLDRDEVINPRPPGRNPKAGTTCDEDITIKVETSVVNPQNTELLYYYTVSGGRVVGTGARVSWDLSGVRAGTYTVTVGIGDASEIYPETQAGTVEVKDCDCGFADACPALEISSPKDSIKAGETIIFTANVAGDFASGTTFNWTVSAGAITEGQGTPKIKVETAPEMAGGGLTATVQIDSERIAGICEKSAAKTVSVTK